MRNIVDWAQSEEGFRLVDGPLAGKPIQLVEHHQRILRYLFTPNGDGKFPHNIIIWSEPKKSAKTTTAAMIHQWFAIFVDKPPKGVDVPPQQFIISNDLKAAKDRVFQYLVGSMQCNPYLRDSVDIRGGSTPEVIFPWGTRIQALPCDYRGEAGSNSTLTSVDEPWGIMYENARRMQTEFQPVPTRKNSILLYTGYAGWEGESEFWEDMYKLGLKGEKVEGLADLPCYADENVFMLWNHEAIMPWHTEGFLAERARSMHPNEFKRVYQNRWVASKDTFIDVRYWDACQDEEHSPLKPEAQGEPMVIALDASEKSDSTAASCRSINPDTYKLPLKMHKIWVPEAGELLGGASVVDLLDVRDWTLKMHRRHQVVAVGYDPTQLHAVALDLSKAGVNMVRIDQGRPRIESDEQWYQLIYDGRLVNYYAPDAREHVNFAVARQSQAGFRLDKRGTTRKIDFAVADSMACYVAMQYKDELIALERRKRHPVLVKGVSRREAFDKVYHRSRW